MVLRRDTGLRRSLSRTSVAASDATYHNLHNNEMFEPVRPGNATIQTKPPSTWKNVPFVPTPMRRQDSGYESIPSESKSVVSRGSSRRTSTTSSSTSSSHARPRTRPSIHRANRSTPTGYTSGNTLSRPGSQHQQQQAVAYFHFPNPEACVGHEEEDDCPAHPPTPPPPQTTHYWTSDHTRRLEYAAIDAASQGVKGWMLRHVVPDCFIPKENRRLRFDDDTGSVRRYRLELDDVPEKEGSGGSGRKLGWLFGRPTSR
ncbi:hypothetical protein PG994_005538 [Apiospora phragmitis]|uniref:Uncharacterized protein n=1 Tax=Apiospora phragmitis TaxID=2905665 RepID=A0ABR1VCK7_9PEZI